VRQAANAENDERPEAGFFHFELFSKAAARRTLVAVACTIQLWTEAGHVCNSVSSQSTPLATPIKFKRMV
jgi:hypothetical protein